MALGQYEKKPEIWEAPLKDSLPESGADKEEHIVIVNSMVAKK